MKKLLILLTLTITTALQAQAPQGFNYQATVRNSSGDLIVNTNVYFKFNVMQGSQTAVPIFTETHYVPTDDLGQVNLVIGQGTANTGTFSELDWSLGSYYLGIELDTGNGYVAMGTTQLLSVPYAMYAENSGNATSTTPNLQSVLTENNSAGQQQIKNLLDPTDGSDAVTKSYVDALSGSQGLMNFNGWDNYQVWNDGTSVQLTPNSFVFVNANDITLVFPDGPDNCCFGDVIYVYVMDGDPLTPLSFNLQANGFPVAVGGGDMPLEFTSTDIISGEFNTVGLKTIVNVGDYWMVADFQGQIITDSDIDNDGDGFTENQGDCDDNNATIYPPVIPTYQQITICSGDTFVFDPVNNPPTTLVPDGTTYTWAVQENTSIITGQSSSNNNQSQISQTLVNLTSDIYGLVYEVTPYSSSGCVGSVFQLSVLVVPSPELEPINDMVLMNGEFGEIVFYPYTADNSATITYDWVSDIDFGAGLSGEGDIFNFFATNSSSIPITGIVNVSATVTYNGTSCFGPSETFTVTVCAEEIQDGIDNDCDGEIDEGFDIDGDGYTVGQGDCDDYDASINPGATEIEDGIDNDCDGEVDEGFDIDGDGYTVGQGDCDDYDASINPGATEIEDGIDNDCDGEVDEGFDIDGDGYTVGQGDCDDYDASINPGATELEDGIDNNCDGEVDEGFNQSGTVTDQDGNTYDYLTYGDQVWTVDNAEMVTYRDGTQIPEETDATQWENLTTGAWSYINNDPTKEKVYNWYAVMGVYDATSLTDPSLRKEFAPEGWHVPSDDEWTTLENYLITNGYNYDGSTSDEKIAKAMASSNDWNSSNTIGAVGYEQNTNNSSEFNAYPNGLREGYGAFNFIGRSSVFWTSTQLDSNSARNRDIYYNRGYIENYSAFLNYGFSVRFVRD